jgi:hypothetical protein
MSKPVYFTLTSIPSLPFISAPSLHIRLVPRDINISCNQTGQVSLKWAVTQHFRETVSSFSGLKMDAVCSSKVLASASPHGVTTKKIGIDSKDCICKIYALC